MIELMTYMCMARNAVLKCIEVADTILPNGINATHLPARLAMLIALVLHRNKATAHAEAQVVEECLEIAEVSAVACRKVVLMPDTSASAVRVGTTYMYVQCATAMLTPYASFLLCCST